MNTIKFPLIATLITTVVTFVVIIAVTVSFLQAPFAGATTVAGNEYNSTTTIATSAGTHWQAKSTTNTTYCSVGSITVASSSATTLTLWDATSTTDVSSTTITALKAAIAEGTYGLDLVCKRGLIVATPTGFNGNYVVTFR